MVVGCFADPARDALRAAGFYELLVKSLLPFFDRITSCGACYFVLGSVVVAIDYKCSLLLAGLAANDRPSFLARKPDDPETLIRGFLCTMNGCPDSPHEMIVGADDLCVFH